MHKCRQNDILKSKKFKNWGIILGSLGRQGKLSLLQKIKRHILQMNLTVELFVMSELLPNIINKINHIDVWIQIACPRLSIDWGIIIIYVYVYIFLIFTFQKVCNNYKCMAF